MPTAHVVVARELAFSIFLLMARVRRRTMTLLRLRTHDQLSRTHDEEHTHELMSRTHEEKWADPRSNI